MPSICLAWNPKCIIVQWVGIGTHTHFSFTVKERNIIPFVDITSTQDTQLKEWTDVWLYLLAVKSIKIYRGMNNKRSSMEGRSNTLWKIPLGVSEREMENPKGQNQGPYTCLRVWNTKTAWKAWAINFIGMQYTPWLKMIPGGVVNFHLKIFNLGARKGGDVHFLIARLYITGLD